MYKDLPSAAFAPVFWFPMEAILVDSHGSFFHATLVGVDVLFAQEDDVLALNVVEDIQVGKSSNNIIALHICSVYQIAKIKCR